MKKVILLKTQLVEAARFGKSDDFRFKRLTVILLDNFIEIQLSSLIRRIFSRDGMFSFQEKKYKEKQRKKTLKYYDELLKTCVKEDLINQQEKFLLAFCHDVRNNLYHKIEEEELLVNVSIRILRDIIINRQPEWKNARDFTVHSYNDFDPYSSTNKSGLLFGLDSDDEWTNFLNKYFNFIDKRKQNSASILSKSILGKINAIKSNYKFVKDEFHIFFPYALDWEFDDYIEYYSFKNINREQIAEIKEIEDKNISDQEYESLFNDYTATWKRIDYSHLKKIESKAKEIKNLDTFKSLEVYISIRDEVNMIYNAMGTVASELDYEIQLAIDIARGK